MITFLCSDTYPASIQLDTALKWVFSRVGSKSIDALLYNTGNSRFGSNLTSPSNLRFNRQANNRTIAALQYHNGQTTSHTPLSVADLLGTDFSLVSGPTLLSKSFDVLLLVLWLLFYSLVRCIIPEAPLPNGPIMSFLESGHAGLMSSAAIGTLMSKAAKVKVQTQKE